MLYDNVQVELGYYTMQVEFMPYDNVRYAKHGSIMFLAEFRGGFAVLLKYSGNFTFPDTRMTTIESETYRNLTNSIQGFIKALLLLLQLLGLDDLCVPEDAPTTA